MTPNPLLIPPSILDTDIFSELGRGRNSGVVMRAILYTAVHQHLTISATTVMEAISGWQRHNRHDRIEAMLERIARWEVLTIDKSIATLAGRIDGDLQRIGQTIGVADALIHRRNRPTPRASARDWQHGALPAPAIAWP